MAALEKKDAKIPEDAPKELLMDKHIDFLKKYGEDKNDYEYVMSEFLRINGVYWALTAMEIMDKSDDLDKEDVSR